MGRANQLMMEMEEQDWEEGEVEFKCPECGKRSDSYEELPVVYHNDMHLELPIDIECLHCKTPFSGVIAMNHGECRIRLDVHPDDIVIAHPQRKIVHQTDDDWWEQYDEFAITAIDPFSEFNIAFVEMDIFASSLSKEQANSLLVRMVFTSAISMLEAYLSDRFTILAMYSQETQKTFLKNKGNKDQVEFTYDELFGAPELAVSSVIARRIRRKVQGYSFHNLGTVIQLYKLYGINPFEGISAEKDKLGHAVQLRHHCVHRNGKDQEGKPLYELSPTYVQGVMSDIKATVENIERAYVRFIKQMEEQEKSDMDSMPF